MKIIKKYTFTKKELTEAFEKWNLDSLNKPDDYYDVSKETYKKDAVIMADVLIEFLDK